MAAPTAAEDTPDIPWAFLDQDFVPNHIRNNDEETVPVYTETDTNSIATWLDAHPDLTTRLQLPLTRYPSPHLTMLDAKQALRRHRNALRPSLWPRKRRRYAEVDDESELDINPLAHDSTLTLAEKRALFRTQQQIIASLFAAIAAKNAEAVSLLVARGFVSPDVPDACSYYRSSPGPWGRGGVGVVTKGGRTPLLAAVDAGDGAMVCLLVGLGAQVDAFGVDTTAAIAAGVGAGGGTGTRTGRLRTPLMAAAARGNLALVRLLRESFGADDALVAPDDGQTALRLAAEAGHRHVVDYLPARRGGAWRRWVVANEAAVARVCRAVGRIVRFAEVLVWHIPKFFVWDVPTYVLVRPAWRAVKFCWTHRREFGGWCKRQAVEFPERVGRAGKAVWRTAKKLPRCTWEVAKGVPRVVRELLKWLWKVIKRIPAAMVTLAAWIWASLKRVGKAVGHVFLRTVAALHTAAAAVLDFFRSIKLADVWNGVCDVLEAIFRGLPRAVWSVVSGTSAVVAGIIVGLLGFSGKLIVWLAEALWFVVKYVPRQLVEIVSAVWSSIARGYHEIMVLINPKH